MSGPTLHRRKFLKMLGMGTAAAGMPVLVAKTASGCVIQSDEYGDFPVEKVTTNYYKCTPGVLKWYIQPESCYDYNGFSCSNCKRVCPFTKPNNDWLHRMIRTFINGKIDPLNRMMVAMDQASGYGSQIQDFQFWKMNGRKSITARESM